MTTMLRPFDLLGDGAKTVAVSPADIDPARAEEVFGRYSAARASFQRDVFEVARSLKAIQEEMLFLAKGFRSFEDWCRGDGAVDPAEARKLIRILNRLGGECNVPAKELHGASLHLLDEVKQAITALNAAEIVRDAKSLPPGEFRAKWKPPRRADPPPRPPPPPVEKFVTSLGKADALLDQIFSWDSEDVDLFFKKLAGRIEAAGYAGMGGRGILEPDTVLKIVEAFDDERLGRFAWEFAKRGSLGPRAAIAAIARFDMGELEEFVTLLEPYLQKAIRGSAPGKRDGEPAAESEGRGAADDPERPPAAAPRIV